MKWYQVSVWPAATFRTRGCCVKIDVVFIFCEGLFSRFQFQTHSRSPLDLTWRLERGSAFDGLPHHSLWFVNAIAERSLIHSFPDSLRLRNRAMDVFSQICRSPGIENRNRTNIPPESIAVKWLMHELRTSVTFFNEEIPSWAAEGISQNCLESVTTLLYNNKRMEYPLPYFMKRFLKILVKVKMDFI